MSTPFDDGWDAIWQALLPAINAALDDGHYLTEEPAAAEGADDLARRMEEDD